MRPRRIKSATLRWAAYGLLLGWVGSWALLVTDYLASRPAPGAGAAVVLVLGLSLPAAFMAPAWGVAAGACGLVSPAAGPRATAVAAVAGLVAGLAYNFWECDDFSGWQVFTIPLYGCSAMVGAALSVAIGGGVARLARQHGQPVAEAEPLSWPTDLNKNELPVTA